MFRNLILLLILASGVDIFWYNHLVSGPHGPDYSRFAPCRAHWMYQIVYVVTNDFIDSGDKIVSLNSEGGSKLKDTY